MLYVLVKTKKGTLVGNYSSDKAGCILGRSSSSLVPMAGRKVADEHAHLEERTDVCM